MKSAIVAIFLVAGLLAARMASSEEPAAPRKCHKCKLANLQLCNANCAPQSGACVDYCGKGVTCCAGMLCFGSQVDVSTARFLTRRRLA